MTIPDRYDAFWIPGPDALDMDLGLRLGYQWLNSVPYRGERVVVLHAKKMLNNRPMLTRASRYHLVSPRCRDIPYATAGPVLDIMLAIAEYRRARVLFLQALGCRSSNRIRWPSSASGSSPPSSTASYL